MSDYPFNDHAVANATRKNCGLAIIDNNGMNDMALYRIGLANDAMRRTVSERSSDRLSVWEKAVSPNLGRAKRALTKIAYKKVRILAAALTSAISEVALHSPPCAPPPIRRRCIGAVLDTGSSLQLTK